MQLHNTLALVVLLGMSGAIVQEQDSEVRVGPWQKQKQSADQQKENASVRVLTKHIRSAIVKDKSLSSNAQRQSLRVVARNDTEVFVTAKTELDRSK